MEVFKRADLAPDPTVYSDWWDKASEREKRLAVGSRRYDAVAKRGDWPRWEHFVNPESGDLLTASELKGEEHADRQERVAAVRAVMDERRQLLRHVLGTGFAPPEAAKPLPAVHAGPRLAARAEVDAAVSQSGALEVFRGVTKPAYGRALRRGKTFTGEGDYGRGLYFSTDQTIADRHAGDEGQVVRAAISPTARVIDGNEAERLHRAAVVAGEIDPHLDLGTFIRSRGYDAISVPHKWTLNVVNPAVLVVQREAHYV